MIQSSFKTLEDYTSELIPSFFPIPMTFDNYIQAWTAVSLGRYMLNTFIFAIITTLILLVVCILAAFAFARLEFKGKNIVFTIFLATMMIPMELFTITNYATIVNLNLRNTFIGLIFPSVMSVFYIYLLRQNFMQVPDQVYYAAKVDGSSDLKYLIKVLIPLSKPTLISIAILKFIECWNSYVWPRLITTKESYFLISNGIQTLRTSGFGREHIPAMMAAVVCVSIPLLVLFAVFRKQIMSGVSKSGLKG
ncbi:MAG: carbohydrate ABC transporter permease [Erysipelotrichaceae bacterium]|nr:carbohydrate ABC transporter permease [Erysipelotrichaceae bacterium]